ncbi:MAG: ATP-binding protein, partial [Desulfobulbaceae bacterium]|nr:ATP-binding protein [Desulfobulbaceae bacterium]
MIKRLLHNTGFRLALWYSAIFISSSILLFIIVYFPLRAAIIQNDRDMIQAKLKEYALQDQESGFKLMLNEIQMERDHNAEHGFWVRLVDGNGMVLSQTIPASWQDFDDGAIPSVLPASGGDVHWSSLRYKQGPGVLEVASLRLADNHLLQVGKGAEEMESLLANFRDIFTSIMLPVVLIGLAGGFFLSYRALSPIRDLIRTVRNIEIGQMDARVPSRHTGDELDELVHLFNNMLAKIETLITGMRAALDNVAHDLRTPLTSMRAAIETTLQNPDRGAKYLREGLMDCAEDSERLVTMINTLMDISEAETGVMQLQSGLINIDAFLVEVVDLYQYVAEGKNVSITVKAPAGLAAIGDVNRLRQVVANLLDNAIKYTPPEGVIRLSAEATEAEILIRVEDTGDGISEQDLSRIFDRLYRG